MCFYLKPPRGGLQLHKLEECINQRTSLLNDLIKRKDLPTNFNCLIDGTALDRTGHFMLRILSAKEGSTSDFLRGEKILFSLRLNSYDSNMLKAMFNTWIRHIKDNLDYNEIPPQKLKFLNLFYKLCLQFLRRDIFEHIFCNMHPPDCNLIYFEIPFTICMKLISSFEVEMRKGIAFVPCSKWNLLFQELYAFNLKSECDLLINNSGLLEIFDDERFEYLIEKRRKIQNDIDVPIITIENIELENEKFPLCMQILHTILKREHRLHHEDRVNLTLFLKNIGLPLNEAINYWKSEYEKPSNHCTSCSHQWKDSEKRYVYSIRHMYGLEGSRRNYGCRNCTQLQEDAVSVRSSGGCPFKLYSNSRLKEILQKRNCSEDIIDRILNTRVHDSKDACQLFVKYQRQSNQPMTNIKNINFSNPVQYYYLNE